MMWIETIRSENPFSLLNFILDNYFTKKIKVSSPFLSFLGNQLSPTLINILLWFVAFQQRSYVSLISPCCPFSFFPLFKQTLILSKPFIHESSCFIIWTSTSVKRVGTDCSMVWCNSYHIITTKDYCPFQEPWHCQRRLSKGSWRAVEATADPKSNLKSNKFLNMLVNST